MGGDSSGDPRGSARTPCARLCHVGEVVGAGGGNVHWVSGVGCGRGDHRYQYSYGLILTENPSKHK